MGPAPRPSRRKRWIVGTIAVIAALIVVGQWNRSRAEAKRWAAVQSTLELPGVPLRLNQLRGYLQRYPDGTYADEAKGRIAALAEDAWAAAAQEGTQEAAVQFARWFPDDPRGAKARAAQAALTRQRKLWHGVNVWPEERQLRAWLKQYPEADAASDAAAWLEQFADAPQMLVGARLSRGLTPLLQYIGRFGTAAGDAQLLFEVRARLRRTTAADAGGALGRALLPGRAIIVDPTGRLVPDKIGGLPGALRTTNRVRARVALVREELQETIGRYSNGVRGVRVTAIYTGVDLATAAALGRWETSGDPPDEKYFQKKAGSQGPTEPVYGKTRPAEVAFLSRLRGPP